MPLILPVDPREPLPAAIERATAALLAGRLVGLPTETVYGLAGDATNPAAVARIFAAKRRPADNPLICHLADPEHMVGLAASVPPLAERLAERFWPGPLTLLLPARPDLVPAVTAGTGRVAVRVPAHAVARAVIAACGRPLAAPSANRSGRPSATTARHVAEDLGDAVAVILDAGPSPLGVESTVLDLTGERPVLARAGGVSVPAIEAVVGPILQPTRVGPQDAPVSPGQKYRHYAPRAPLFVVLGDTAERARRLAAQIAAWRARGNRVAVVGFEDNRAVLETADAAFLLGAAADADAAAHRLFATLRAADATGPDVILAEAIPEQGLGAAANDRLLRAATGVVTA